MLDMIDIYHGSVNVVEQPLFGEGKLFNDYGRGFYCTEHAELAKEWACSSGYDGYANHYQLDMTGLSVLNLNGPEYNILRSTNSATRKHAASTARLLPSPWQRMGFI